MTNDVLVETGVILPPDLIEHPEKEVQVKIAPVLSEILPISLTAEQTRELEKLSGNHVDAIRILAAGTAIRRDDVGNVSWSSPDYTENDGSSVNLASGAVVRVAAGGILARVYPDARVIVGSRYRDFGKTPHPFQVMAEELKILGVAEERLVTDPETLDTIGEIAHLLSMAKAEDTRLIAPTNNYHLERVEAIKDNIEWLTFPEERTPEFNAALARLRRGELTINVISAESIINAYNESIFAEHIKPHIENGDLEKRNTSEKVGTEDILSGKYVRTDRNGERITLRRN